VTLQILLTAKKILNPSKPIHMFGLGLPQFFSLAVASGCDLMDSAAYILFAREKRYFTLSTGTKKLEEIEEFPCHCPVCTQYTPSELRELEEPSQIELLARHNLYLSFSELRTIRQAIKEGNLWELVEQRIRNHPSLVDAAQVLYKESPYIERFEKVYKSHGRMFSSIESLQRPIIQRYLLRIQNNYRVPEGVDFLIIVPELDVRGKSSPSVKEWINLIDNNMVISRERLHVVLLSPVFGIIPLELSETFPLAQYERSNLMTSKHAQEHCLKMISPFFKSHGKSYNKCAIIVPEEYTNQFDEVVKFTEDHPINEIKSYIEKETKINCTQFKHIQEIFEFFKITESL
ncbi:MAG: tRNA-guanine transglycosylase, partial [Promethearchaeota archaeon]